MPFRHGAQENLQEWMLDKRGRDQFVIRYRDQTEIYWNDAARSQVRCSGPAGNVANTPTSGWLGVPRAMAHAYDGLYGMSRSSVRQFRAMNKTSPRISWSAMGPSNTLPCTTAWLMIQELLQRLSLI